MRIAIVGGGIAGLTASIALRRAGLEPILYESHSSLRADGAGLGLGANAIKAFRHLGLADEVMAAGHLLDAFSILDMRGRVIMRTDSRAISSRFGADNFAIHRSELHRVLSAHVPSESLRLASPCNVIERADGAVRLYFANGMNATADVVIAADGLHSAVRRQIYPHVKPRYAGYTCWRGVVDGHDLALKEATETWGPRGRVGIVPLADGRIYWFATTKAPERDPRYHAFGVHDVLGLYRGYHQPIGEVIARTEPSALLHNDISDLPPLPRFAFGNIVLLGDAAHATTPNMGQGACQAIEDAVVLAECWKCSSDPATAFRTYEQCRMKRTQTIVHMSRHFGAVAQIQSRWGGMLRNAVLRRMPATVQERRLQFLFDVDFDNGRSNSQ
jgi:2-polyprenyl-6-methoxyphenol hydroxylase-like FAD-dependent oxidoreductase